MAVSGRIWILTIHRMMLLTRQYPRIYLTLRGMVMANGLPGGILQALARLGMNCEALSLQSLPCADGSIPYW